MSFKLIFANHEAEQDDKESAYCFFALEPEKLCHLLQSGQDG